MRWATLCLVIAAIGIGLAVAGALAFLVLAAQVTRSDGGGFSLMSDFMMLCFLNGGPLLFLLGLGLWLAAKIHAAIEKVRRDAAIDGHGDSQPPRL